MNPYRAELLAKELINQHLTYLDWKFKFDNAKRRFGRCQYGTKTISLSKPLVIANDEAQVRDTILHEIAHALAPGHGHDNHWKNRCRAIGANPQRCYSADEVSGVIAPYGLYCPTCDVVIEERYRRTQGIRIHRACNTQVEWVAYG